VGGRPGRPGGRRPVQHGPVRRARRGARRVRRVTQISELRTPAGRQLSGAAFDECFNHAPKTGATGTFGDTAVCLGKLDLHVDMAYQPNRRFWPFQWIELGLYLAFGALLAALGRWQIQRRVS
jgi:hypothetical protein